MRDNTSKSRETGSKADHPQDQGISMMEAVGRRLAKIEQDLADITQTVQLICLELKWFTTEELADAMGVSHYTVHQRWCNAGRVGCEKDPDTGKWRIPAREFIRLVRGGGLASARR